MIRTYGVLYLIQGSSLGPVPDSASGADTVAHLCRMMQAHGRSATLLLMWMKTCLVDDKTDRVS